MTAQYHIQRSGKRDTEDVLYFTQSNEHLVDLTWTWSSLNDPHTPGCVRETYLLDLLLIESTSLQSSVLCCDTDSTQWRLMGWKEVQKARALNCTQREKAAFQGVFERGGGPHDEIYSSAGNMCSCRQWPELLHRYVNQCDHTSSCSVPSLFGNKGQCRAPGHSHTAR